MLDNSVAWADDIIFQPGGNTISKMFISADKDGIGAYVKNESVEIVINATA
jgi:hypothetical protein